MEPLCQKLFLQLSPPTEEDPRAEKQRILDALHLFLHFSAKGAANCSAFFILCHSSSLILTLRERAETGFQFQSPLSLFPYR